jgi:hypothetical protein
MSDSGETRIETRNDTFDAFVNLLKYPYPGGLGWRRKALERYKNGRLFVHFHAIIRRGADRWPECCEIHFQSGHPAEGPLPFIAAIDGESTGALYEPSAQQERSVLVYPYELFEGTHRLIPSVVRLNALDYAHGRCGHPTNPRQIIRGPIRFGETRIVVGDEELHLPLLPIGQGAPAEDDKFPCDVVKAGPQIGGEIPDYAREGRGRLGCDDTFNTFDIPLRFGDDFIGLCAYVPPGVFVERFQVLLSPDDFEAGTV